MIKVLLSQTIKSVAIERLRLYADIVQIKEGDISELKEHISDSHAIVLGTSVKITQELLKSAMNLKVISRTGAGVDNVDIVAATKKGILVLNTPDANSVSVAEHTVMLICALAKQVVYLDKQVRRNNYGVRRQYFPVDLYGKTLGLVGCGRIGEMVAKKCINAFDMKVMSFDPHVKIFPTGITGVGNLDEIFINSDFISLHIPLSKTTCNLVDKRLLSLMKPSSFLINTARGGIVDETALINILKEKAIAGAALDVLLQEPPDSDNDLLNLDNVILTPHTAALTKECTDRVALEAIEGVIEYIQGKIPKNIVNREVLS